MVALRALRALSALAQIALLVVLFLAEVSAAETTRCGPACSNGCESYCDGFTTGRACPLGWDLVDIDTPNDEGCHIAYFDCANPTHTDITFSGFQYAIPSPNGVPDDPLETYLLLGNEFRRVDTIAVLGCVECGALGNGDFSGVKNDYVCYRTIEESVENCADLPPICDGEAEVLDSTGIILCDTPRRRGLQQLLGRRR